jgi:acetylornithine deacetylase/succinyl-diaminopimelate desuccinylase-like protein
MSLAAALRYAGDNRSRFVDELTHLVRFPSVSVDPKRAGDVAACARWLAGHLRSIGLGRARVVPTARHPIVLAEWGRAPGRPTLLVYGHYDVQPADPLSAWYSPPFTPTVRGEDLFARGASDDKGQLFCHVKAIESHLATAGRLPVNVVCLFEGEEEIGSPNLPGFLRAERGRLRPDVAVMSDSRMRGPGRPAITYAMRGALSMEIELRGGERDLHSGQFGGAVPGALEAACRLAASLHDAQGRVRVPGFYARVRELTPGERASMAREGPDDAEFLRDAGTDTPSGEPGYTLYERATARPALTVNGIAGGYAGPGGKAVIPACAEVKLNFRLVPDQDPVEVDRLVRGLLPGLVPPGVSHRVRTSIGARPAVTDVRHPVVRAAARACRHGFGVGPVLLRTGGTIPIVDTFQRELGIPTVLLGFALPDDGLHAPNEKLNLPTFARGVATCVAYLDELARLPAPRAAPEPAVR